MTLNVTKLIMTPVIRTKSRLGSQCSFNKRNPYIFVLCDIPAIMSPHPNMTPIPNKYILAVKVLDFSKKNNIDTISVIPIA